MKKRVVSLMLAAMMMVVARAIKPAAQQTEAVQQQTLQHLLMVSSQKLTISQLRFMTVEMTADPIL